MKIKISCSSTSSLCALIQHAGSFVAIPSSYVLNFEVLPFLKPHAKSSDFLFHVFLDLQVGFARGGIVECRMSAPEERNVLSVETGSDSTEYR